jgi:hypothetical protein
MDGYQTPGVAVTEVNTPNTAIVIDRPTVIGLVGHAQGNQTHSESALLLDNDPFTLFGTNPVTTPSDSFSVRDTTDLSTVYENGRDYIINPDPTTGVTTIRRRLHTTMTSKEKVVIVANATSNEVSSAVYLVSETQVPYTILDYQNPSEWMRTPDLSVIDITGDGDAPTNVDISVQRAGKYIASSDYTFNSSNNRISRTGPYNPVAGSCHIFDGQTVYVSYTTDNGIYVDEAVTLKGTTGSNLLHGSEQNLSINYVRNCAGMKSSENIVTVFTAGANGSAGVDFQFSYSGTPSSATTLSITRNVAGPTRMGTNNQVNVRIDYKYIPVEYYQPTLFSSFNEVEKKYGPAFDSSGRVLNSLSAGAYMCFRSGSNEIIAQALYTTNTSGMRVEGSVTDVNHWGATLEGLRGQSSINLLIPVVGQSDGLTDDKMNAVFSKVVDHINVMNSNGEYVIALLGEDSTVNNAIGTNASAETLRNHAKNLSIQDHPERTVLISPAAFKFANPVSGGSTLIGGQYVACALAGMMANAPIQAALTRKQVVSVIDVATSRTEAEKTEDSQSGLLVIENKNGVIRVRHGITTAVGDAVKRELNAMRSKFFMIETLSKTLDSNIIGRVISDARAPFIIKTQVMTVLDALKGSGVITNYGSVAVDAVISNPTAMTVRFAYSLPFSVNNIEVVIGLDTITGTITAQ